MKMKEKGESNSFKEIFRFVVSGGICFVVEFVVLVLLRDGCGMDTLIATALAFLVSVCVNYILCVKWVFNGIGEQGRKQKIGFFVTSGLGLGLNVLLMYLFRLIFGEDSVVLTLFTKRITMYMVNKIFATIIVMVWNYFTKKTILRRA